MVPGKVSIVSVIATLRKLSFERAPAPNLSRYNYLRVDIALISASNSFVGLNCPRSSNGLITVGFSCSTIPDFSIRYICT